MMRSSGADCKLLTSSWLVISIYCKISDYFVHPFQYRIGNESSVSALHGFWFLRVEDSSGECNVIHSEEGLQQVLHTRDTVEIQRQNVIQIFHKKPFGFSHNYFDFCFGLFICI